jgi:hypothetical protein
VLWQLLIIAAFAIGFVTRRFVVVPVVTVAWTPCCLFDTLLYLAGLPYIALATAGGVIAAKAAKRYPRRS